MCNFYKISVPTTQRQHQINNKDKNNEMGLIPKDDDKLFLSLQSQRF